MVIKYLASYFDLSMAVLPYFGPPQPPHRPRKNRLVGSVHGPGGRDSVWTQVLRSSADTYQFDIYIVRTHNDDNNDDISFDQVL